MNDIEETAILSELRMSLDREIKRRRFAKPTCKRDFSLFAREGEQIARSLIESLGYHVAPTVHTAPFDLWVWNECGSARVEVKISMYHPARDGRGRYQAAIRNHEHDLVIFIARNGHDWPFVIPAKAVPKTSLTIWTKCPADSGPYRNFLQAWDHLHQAIKPMGFQLPLLECL